jgi:MYXO-CTERM domain-containing protein
MPKVGSRRAALWLVTTILLSIAFLLLGGQPGVPRALRGISDWVLHAVAYLVLAVVAGRAALLWGLRWPLVVAFFYTAAHGAGLELLQYFNPPRRAEWSDLVADVAGALLGVGVAWLWQRRRP